jgi:4-hydroxy-3-methylbut-2-en-1-yl diphosphate reductase
MSVEIVKSPEIGFCFGVRRAIKILEKEVHKSGNLETLGAVVHNEQVLQRLNKIGVKVIDNVQESQCDTLAISSHGLSPDLEAELRSAKKKIIDTTCPFVRRAQVAAQQLADAGFFIIIYGDAGHPEVKGILGWAKGQGLATLVMDPIKNLERIPLKLGILSQTTQIPEKFIGFAKEVIDLTFQKDSEIRILDTICPGVRKRQSVTSELARRVDVMLIVGGRHSANTKRLLDLCEGVTEAHFIAKADDISPNWIKDKKVIGIASGTSTPDEAINDVVAYLKDLTGSKT